MLRKSYADNKKNFKPRKISKHKIKDIRKLSKFQRLKHRLDAISLNQRHEDSNQNTKSSGGDSDSEHTPLNNYTIKIKGDMEGCFYFVLIKSIY